MKISALAPIEVEILFLASLARKRLERIAGLAPEKIINKKTPAQKGTGVSKQI